MDSTYAPRAAIVGSDNYGDNYREIKEALADVILGMTSNPDQTEEDRMETAKQRILLLLAWQVRGEFDIYLSALFGSDK